MVKMVHNNNYDVLCATLKDTLKDWQQNNWCDLSPGVRYLIAESLISSSPLIKLSFYSTQYLISTQIKH